MPKRNGWHNTYKMEPHGGIPIHPSIYDTRTVREVLAAYDVGTRSEPHAPGYTARVSADTPSDQAKLQESAFHEPSTKDRVTVYCAHCILKCITECPQ